MIIARRIVKGRSRTEATATPAEVAKLLGVSVDVIYKALVKRHLFEGAYKEPGLHRAGRHNKLQVCPDVWRIPLDALDGVEVRVGILRKKKT